jgi:hypothetical protein
MVSSLAFNFVSAPNVQTVVDMRDAIGTRQPNEIDLIEAREILACQYRQPIPLLLRLPLGGSASNELTGSVTGTEFGRAKIGKPSSGSGRGGGSPRLERFFSEDAERAAGGEMALDGCRQVNEFGLSSMVNADHVDFL